MNDAVVLIEMKRSSRKTNLGAGPQTDIKYYDFKNKVTTLFGKIVAAFSMTCRT